MTDIPKLLKLFMIPIIHQQIQMRLHIAATSSSEVCEVLLANKADFMACSADKDCEDGCNMLQQKTASLLCRNGGTCGTMNTWSHLGGVNCLKLRPCSGTCMILMPIHRVQQRLQCRFGRFGFACKYGLPWFTSLPPRGNFMQFQWGKS